MPRGGTTCCGKSVTSGEAGAPSLRIPRPQGSLMKTLGGEDALQLVLFEVDLRRAPSCPPTFDRYRTTTFQVMQEKAVQTSNGVLLVDRGSSLGFPAGVGGLPWRGGGDFG